MRDDASSDTDQPKWFAIRTRRESYAAEYLRPLCHDVFFPTETIVKSDMSVHKRALIPHVLFIYTTRETALSLEQKGKRHPDISVPFWIYRYPTDKRIQEIDHGSIELLRLLGTPEGSGCEIFSKTDFKDDELVEVTGGIYRGCRGHVQRVKKNKHVIVRIEGICLVMLPFIHPSLLKKIY